MALHTIGEGQLIYIYYIRTVLATVFFFVFGFFVVFFGGGGGGGREGLYDLLYSQQWNALISF